MNYASYSKPIVEDIARLRRRIEVSGLPSKLVDNNLLVSTWNVRAFGDIHKAWDENPGSPKRNLRALAYIAEVISRLDVVAVQEVRRSTSAIRLLLKEFL
ncbi:MAG: hypothetical protein U9R15_12900 [Chloroflexota bacterium]|nr:hypothetical protein [Chloroflexota bacterium]